MVDLDRHYLEFNCGFFNAFIKASLLQSLYQFSGLILKSILIELLLSVYLFTSVNPSGLGCIGENIIRGSMLSVRAIYPFRLAGTSS